MLLNYVITCVICSDTFTFYLIESSEKDSHVPGVNDLGNLRPRLRGGRTKEVKAVMPVVQPTVEDVDLQNPRTQSLASSSVRCCT